MFILLPTPPHCLLPPSNPQTWMTLVYPSGLNMDFIASWKPSLMPLDSVEGPIIPPSLLVTLVTDICKKVQGFRTALLLPSPTTVSSPSFCTPQVFPHLLVELMKAKPCAGEYLPLFLGMESSSSHSYSPLSGKGSSSHLHSLIPQGSETSFL